MVYVLNYLYIAILLFFLGICISINNLIHPVQANSPAFGPLYEHGTNNKTKQIIVASYFSNGKTLNATIALSPSHFYKVGIRFGMQIRLSGGDYYSYIELEHNGSLTNHMVQTVYGTTYNLNRTLTGLHAFTGSYNKANGFVDLSLNLADIGYPEEYYVNFYLANQTGQHIDNTRDIEVPRLCALDCLSVQIPSSIPVMPGQHISVPIIVRPGNATQFISLADKTFNEDDTLAFIPPKEKDMQIKLEPSSALVPLSGERVFHLAVNVPNNALSQNQTLLLNEKFRTPNGRPFNGPSQHLTLQILQPPKPLSLSENITAYLSSPEHIYVTISIPIVLTALIVLAILRVVDINKSTILGKLSIADVIQVDATVIVGVLVLLTLGSLFHQKFFVIGVVIASIVYPFALSAMIVTIKGTVEHGIKLTFSGFVYLMVAVILLSFLAGV